MADLGTSRSTPLHPGVDAQSWLGFEQKIQARRFDALLASAKDAIANGNAVLAQHAIDEAREIHPESREVHELEAGVRRLLPAQQGAAMWRRAAGGFMLLAAGVSMFVVVDEMRILPHALPVVAPPPPRLLRAVPVAGRFERAAMFAEAIEADEGESMPEGTPDTGVNPAVIDTPGLRRTAPLAPAVQTPTTRADDGSSSEAMDRMELANRFEPVSQSGPHDRVELARPVLRSDVAQAAPILAAASPVPAVINAVHVDRTAEEQVRVADVLRRYARAYGDLDVSAAREVWPDVDQRALARAFDGLASQPVSFADCQIDVQGATANASCHGQASYIGKVGRGAPRTEPRTWRFKLRRDGETWKIANAEARRTTG
jgi:hypothetical protein